MSGLISDGFEALLYGTICSILFWCRNIWHRIFPSWPLHPGCSTQSETFRQQFASYLAGPIRTKTTKYNSRTSSHEPQDFSVLHRDLETSPPSSGDAHHLCLRTHRTNLLLAPVCQSRTFWGLAEAREQQHRRLIPHTQPRRVIVISFHQVMVFLFMTITKRQRVARWTKCVPLRDTWWRGGGTKVLFPFFRSSRAVWHTPILTS